MRKQIIDGLRMAGQKVQNFDDAYANKLAEYIGSFKPENASMGQGLQVAAGLGAGVPATRKFAVEEENDLLRALMGYGVPAVNAGVRYGVPAAGLIGVSSGIGALYDMASQTPVEVLSALSQVTPARRKSVGPRLRGACWGSFDLRECATQHDHPTPSARAVQDARLAAHRLPRGCIL